MKLILRRVVRVVSQQDLQEIMKKILFNIREFLWVCVSEVEDWLYPYRNRLTPEERFEVRVKDPMTEEMYMVEELIQSLNQKVDKLQDDMVWIKGKIAEHEQLLQLNPKFRVRKVSESFSVSGSIRQNSINT